MANRSLRPDAGWRGIYAWLVALCVIGVALVVAGASDGHVDTREVMFETGIRLVAVTVIGLVGTVVLKRIEERRRHQAALQELLTSTLRAYNAAKAARRRLQALGFSEDKPSPALDARLAEQTWHVIEQLSDAQLELEINKRTVGSSGLFRDASEPFELLAHMEDYLNSEAVEPWEDGGTTLLSVPSGGTATLPGLDAFITRKRPGDSPDFESGIATPIDRFIDLVHEELDARWWSRPRRDGKPA